MRGFDTLTLKRNIGGKSEVSRCLTGDEHANRFCNTPDPSLTGYGGR